MDNLYTHDKYNNEYELSSGLGFMVHDKRVLKSVSLD